jgi:hypothetical protein
VFAITTSKPHCRPCSRTTPASHSCIFGVCSLLSSFSVTVSGCRSRSSHRISMGFYRPPHAALTNMWWCLGGTATSGCAQVCGPLPVGTLYAGWLCCVHQLVALLWCKSCQQRACMHAILHLLHRRVNVLSCVHCQGDCQARSCHAFVVVPHLRVAVLSCRLHQASVGNCGHNTQRMHKGPYHSSSM